MNLEFKPQEIKFKVWDEQEFGWLSPFGEVHGLGEMIDKPSRFKVVRYIGIKDINNKEIFEGDIVEWNEDIGDFTSAYIRMIGNVQYNVDWCRFEINIGHGCETIGRLVSKSLTVIGNVFENRKI